MHLELNNFCFLVLNIYCIGLPRGSTLSDMHVIIQQIYKYICKSLLSFGFREEIQRIKASNPDISHREAFSTAAKNVSSNLNI